MNLFAPTFLAGVMSDLQPLVDPFLNDQLAPICAQIFDALMIFAALFAFIGLLMISYKAIVGGTFEGILGQIVTMGIVVSIMPFFPQFMLDMHAALGDGLLEQFGVDPAGMLDSFGDSFGELDMAADSSGVMDLFGLLDPFALIEYIAKIIANFCMIVIGFVCYIVFFIAFQVQIMAIMIGTAASPIFFGMFLWDMKKDTAITYFTGLVAICFWPLGWGIGLLLAEFLLTVGIEICIIIGGVLRLGAIGVVIEVIAIFIVVIMVFTWIMFVLFQAPKIVNKALMTGAQIGTAFAGSMISSATGAVSAGVGVAGAVGGMMPGKAGEAASGAAKAAGGAVSGIGSSLGGFAEE